MFFTELRKNIFMNKNWLLIGLCCFLIILMMTMSNTASLVDSFEEYYDYPAQGLLFVGLLFPCCCWSLYLLSFKENLYTKVRIKNSFATNYDFQLLILNAVFFTVTIMFVYFIYPLFNALPWKSVDSMTLLKYITVSNVYLFFNFLLFGACFFILSSLIKSKKISFVLQVVFLNLLYFSQHTFPVLKKTFQLTFFNIINISGSQIFFAKTLILLGTLFLFYCLSRLSYSRKEQL